MALIWKTNSILVISALLFSNIMPTHSQSAKLPSLASTDGNSTATNQTVSTNNENDTAKNKTADNNGTTKDLSILTNISSDATTDSTFTTNNNNDTATELPISTGSANSTAEDTDNGNGTVTDQTVTTNDRNGTVQDPTVTKGNKPDLQPQPKGTTPATHTKHHDDSTTKVVSKEDIILDVQSQIKIEDGDWTYSKSLEDETTKEFEATKTHYEEELENAFKDFPNFKKVEVTSFEEGSLIVNYATYFYMVDDGKDLTKEDLDTDFASEKIVEALANITGINKTLLAEQATNFNKALASTAADPCETTSNCDDSDVCEKDGSGGIKCVDKCTHEKTALKCKNGGHCVIEDNEPACSCISSNKVSYSGAYCQNERKHLPFSDNVLIAICAGGGGGIILILIVVILVICHRRDQKKTSGYLTETRYRGSSEASFKSMKDAEGALNDSDIAGPRNGGQINNGFSYLEENALNTKRTSNPYEQTTTSFSMDLSNGYELQARSPPSNSGVESNPDYPTDRRVYEEIEDKGTPSILYKGSSVYQNPAHGHIYDYARRDSKMSQKSETTLYDFDEVNKQERYKIRRPTINSETAN